MRIAKINQSIKTAVDESSHITKYIDIDTLERVEYDAEIDIDNPKTFPKIVKAIKAMVRTSPEYKALVTFLKEHYDMNKSFFFKGIKNTKDRQGKDYSIELHHTPFVLEDIVVTVIKKRMANGESLKFLLIIEEIMYLHYVGLIGLAPLDKTMHALIHNEASPEVFIPLQYVPFGDFDEFFSQYRKFIPDNTKVSYLYLQDLSLKYEKISDTYPSYLKPKFLYYEGFMRIDALTKLLEDLEMGGTLKD